MSVTVIPTHLLDLIPKYDGDEKLLNLFISKCEYVLLYSGGENNPVQNLYRFHCISSKLIGRAATLLSDNPSINSWTALKDVLTQHFGDPRSEECIAIELESLKIKHGESYIQFCNRIQSVRSSLFAKVHRLSDEGIKAAKMIIYNNTALNVFIYNLPEDLIRIVRLKSCPSLEVALSIVTEEVNFLAQYNAKNNKPKPVPQLAPQNLVKSGTFQNYTPPFDNHFKFGISNIQSGNKPNFVQPNRFTLPQQGFRYGIPQNSMTRNFSQPFTQQPRAPFQRDGFKFGIPQHQGQRFGMQNQSQPNQFKFGIPQQSNQFKFGIPQQSNQFKFGIQNRPNKNGYDTDVSMRTAPIRQNMTNDLYYMETSPNYMDNPDETDYDINPNETQYYDEIDQPPTDYNYFENDGEDDANFQEVASKDVVK